LKKVLHLHRDEEGKAGRVADVKKYLCVVEELGLKLFDLLCKVVEFINSKIK
jgi:hypothetical protein